MKGLGDRESHSTTLFVTFTSVSPVPSQCLGHFRFSIQVR